MPGVAGTSPVLSLLLMCTRLSSTFYPSDTVNWFSPSQHPQIVLYAHMLFPLQPPEPGRQNPRLPLETPGPWHPPLILPSPTPPEENFLAVGDRHYVESEWMDPDGQVVAQFGLTMPARVSADYVLLETRQYIPHTFTHTIGTRDLRVQAGQKALPAKPGQYHVYLYVDGKLLGITFFKMLEAGKTGLGDVPKAVPAPAPVTIGAGGI